MRRIVSASAVFLVIACTGAPSPPPPAVTVVNPDLPSGSLTTQDPPPPPDDAGGGDEGASDADAGEAEAGDAGDVEAGDCSRDGVPSMNFDQQLTYECAREAGPFTNVGVSTKECGGVIALIVQDGVDGQQLYLYDPATKACLELAGGANGSNSCIASTSGVALATSCTDSVGYAPLTGSGPFGFVEACGTDGGPTGDSAADGGSEGGAYVVTDSGTNVATDARGE